MKKIIVTALALVLVAGLSIGGTVAYLQSTDSDVNTMTLGNVKIEQLEYERVFGDDGEVIDMDEFTQDKPLFPAVITGDATANNCWQPNKDVDIWYKDHLGEEFPGGNGTWQNLNNVQDKFVFVKNTGKSDAYYRTIILLEADTTGAKNSVTGQSMIHLNTNGHSNFTWMNETGDIDKNTLVVEVNGVKYTVEVATYTQPLTAGEVSRPSLLQVGLDQEATNEIVAQFGDKYDILVLSQAVQTEGFADAETALNTAFGEVNATNVAKWFANITPGNSNSEVEPQ